MKQLVVRLAFYGKTNYNYLLSVLDDTTDMFSTYELWLENHKIEKKEYYEKGFKVREIKYDIDELIEYCEVRSLKINKKTIQQFVDNY